MQQRKVNLMISICVLVAGILGYYIANRKALNIVVSEGNKMQLHYESVSRYRYGSFDYSQPFDHKTGRWRSLDASAYVTLPDNLAEITISKKDLTPDEEDIDAGIKTILADYDTSDIQVNVTDRKAKLGDTVHLDYVGRVQNVAFTGGSAENYTLTLGSHSFIDDFEEQVAGHQPGERFDVTVTFPEGYADTTDEKGQTVVLAGKEAVFTCKLLSIVDYEVTDAWVYAQLSDDYDVETVSDLHRYVSKQLYMSSVQEKMYEALIKKAVIKAMPQVIFDYESTRLLAIYYAYAKAQDTTLSSYAQAYGYKSVVDMMNKNAQIITTSCAKELFTQALAQRLDVAGSENDDPFTYIDVKNAYGEGYAMHQALVNQVYRSCLNEITLK